jgi:hypothetical protein
MRTVDVKIIYANDGHGLKKDADILQALLQSFGCNVHVCMRSRVFGQKKNILRRLYGVVLYKFNGLFFLKQLYSLPVFSTQKITIHLENICMDGLREPGKHVLIPNQEWFKPSATGLLSYIDIVWCKSILAAQVFSAFAVKTSVVGFTSQGRVSQVQRNGVKTAAFISRIGNSALRGVEVLVETWRRHPEWPELNIVVPIARRIFPCPNNVIYIDEFTSAEEYLEFSGQFKFQIFATQTEGFGHSIFEAVDAGSIVLVTDGAPMNEWFSEPTAIMIAAKYKGQHRLSPSFGVTQEGLETAIADALALTDHEVSRYKELGYRQLDELQRNFTVSLKNAFKELMQDENVVI